ncbi:MAG: NADH-quinone oxidoreductase subunit L [Actinomycetota bacterium]|nr:NADH-quinone oxidoreductase subunit L [Actinomycetota bacterium]
MLDAVWLIPALPLAGFLLLLVVGRKLGDPGAGYLATTMVAASFVVSLIVFFGLLGEHGEERHFTQTLFTWIPAGSLSVDVGLLVDPLSITMALFVTGVGSLIHLYAIGYMHGDERYSKFFVYMNLFAFSMLVLVLADSFLLTFLGWEGVGVCSYFLISFWFERDTAAVAGKKAFVTNRIGDFGFMVAMFLIFASLGSLQYAAMEEAETLSKTTATAIALLLFLGAAGKSAQLPLYVWLPDAMEGPTPVSALIHAATMVTAGVFLMARVNPILDLSDPAMTLIATIGVLTALFAATVACAQDDIKRVLAYSTISQLGYMFLAVGVGAYVAAIFHMVTHAFFKALLFLGAGSVMHGLHDEQDMNRMGGLRRWMPITASTFIVAWLAIAGVFPFAGFWSKDEILVNAWEQAPVLWALGLLTAFLTAYYMSRQVFMVFYGPERWQQAAAAHSPGQAESEPDHEPAASQPATAEPAGVATAAPATPATSAAAQGAHGDFRPHESPPVMAAPLVILAVLSAIGGILNLPFAGYAMEHFLEPVFGERLHHLKLGTGTKVALAAITMAVALAGIGIAYLIYIGRRAKRPEPEVLRRGWYVDEAFAGLVGGPGRRLADWSAYVFDNRVIDGAVNGVATLVRAGGGRLRTVQSGFVRSYALAVAVGAVGILAWVVARS